MPRATVFPYLRANPERAEVEWLISRHGEDPLPLPGVLADWDPQVSLSVGARLMIDGTRMIRDTLLDGDTVLRGAMSWYCRTTQLRGLGTVKSLPLEEMEHSFSCELPGGELGGSVELQLSVVLPTAGKGGSPLRPRRPGSVLWSASTNLTLEGIGGRFPIQWIDFDKAITLPDGGAWWLDWNPSDLSELVGRSLRLFLNSEHPALQKAVADPESDLGRTIFEAIYFDVGRTLIIGALENDDFMEDPDQFQTGSIGAELRRLLQTLFPQTDLAGIRDSLFQDRFRFDRDLQSSLRLFRSLVGKP